MKSVEWWRGTAKHMWRTYFALKNKDVTAMSPADMKIYDICNRIFTDSFVKSDRDILQMYFTSRWGDDLYAVEDYSLKHNISTKVIWIVINKASRMTMEATGLLDRKEGEQNE